MAFEFGSNILIDAMKAADPARAAQAKERLEQLSTVRNTVNAKNTGIAKPFSADLAAPRAPEKSIDSHAESMRKFEAVVLTTFIQNMMPKDASSVYGEGLAGEMWKSQLAEKIADQLSKRGGIGIANRLLKDYQKTSDQVSALQGVSDPAMAVIKNRDADASARFIQKIQMEVLSSGAENGDKQIMTPLNALDG